MYNIFIFSIIFLRPDKPDTSFMYTNKAVIIRIDKSILVFNMKVEIEQLMNNE